MLVNLSGSEKSTGRDTIGKNLTALLQHLGELCAFYSAYRYMHTQRGQGANLALLHLFHV